MLKNYFVTNFRMLWKNKSHALINIAGLSLGISCAIIIFIIVRFERSFDTYHDDTDRIYRVVVEHRGGDKPSVTAGLAYPVAEAMRQDFPDVEYSTITDTNSGAPVIGVTGKDGVKKLFKEEHSAFADAEFFKIFKYQWIEGNPEDGLTRLQTVVITKSIARKYFGDGTAINQVLSYNGKYEMTVSGVIEDAPQNTDFPFDIIMSYNLGANKHSWDNWTSSSGGIQCYIKLKNKVHAADLQKKMKGWHLKYFQGDDAAEGKDRTYFLQPLSEIHYDHRYDNYKKTTSTASLLALSLIGGLLLLTACINFINLNTVLIVNRAKEVGVRKVMGSGKASLVLQFLGETFLITMISLIISLTLVEIGLNNLNTVLGYNIKFRPFADGFIALFIVSIPVVVTLLAGLYPGLSLASFQPIQALKNKMSVAGGGVNFRRALIGFQLVISQALVVSTIIIIQQMDFFTNQPLGLNSSAIVEFETPEQKNIDFKALKGRIENIAGVESVTISNTGAAASSAWGGGFEAKVKGQLIKADAQVKFIDEDYFKTYQITILAGNNITSADSATSFLVNETFVKELGLKNPEEAIGVYVAYWGTKKALINGVVKDFHANSLHNGIEPVIFMAGPEFYHTASIKLQTANAREVMDKIEVEWKNVFPNYVFQYGFLDDTIDNFYTQERRTSRLISIFAIIAVLIGSIGLLGLVSFMVTKRTKEVGIRKTLGASVPGIMALFSKEFLVLILVSFVIAAPAAAYITKQWLEGFAYHITPGVITFAAGAIVSLIVVLLTVGFISYRAATANPVTSLRNE